MFTKIALTMIVLVMLGSMAGCGTTPGNSSANAAANIPEASSPDSGNVPTTSDNQQALPIIAGKGVILNLDASADGSTQQLKANEQMAITLESNPSTGYAWHAKSSDPAIIDQLGEAQYNAPASTSTEPLLGAAGTETIYFKTTSSGTATLTLEYKRGWETDVAPEKTLTITVEVK